VDQVARQAVELELLRQELKQLVLQKEDATKRAQKAESDAIDARREGKATVGELRRQREADQLKSQATIAEMSKIQKEEARQAAVKLTQVKQELESLNDQRKRDTAAYRKEIEEAKQKCRQAEQELRKAEDKLAEHEYWQLRRESYPRKKYGYYERVTRNGGDPIPRE
jgi:hypothetical protein